MTTTELNEWKAAAAGSGNSTQARLIRHLARHFKAAGSCTQTKAEIGAALGMSPDWVGVTLKRLACRGWISISHPTPTGRHFTTYRPTKPPKC